MTRVDRCRPLQAVGPLTWELMLPFAYPVSIFEPKTLSEAATDWLIRAFYWPTVLWVEHPMLTLLPVTVFGAACWQMRRTRPRSRGLLIASTLWLLYAAYEGLMSVWAQRVIAPIRIDLILLGPLMYVVTAMGVFSWWRSRRARSKP